MYQHWPTALERARPQCTQSPPGTSFLFYSQWFNGRRLIKASLQGGGHRCCLREFLSLLQELSLRCPWARQLTKTCFIELLRGKHFFLVSFCFNSMANIVTCKTHTVCAQKQQEQKCLEQQIKGTLWSFWTPVALWSTINEHVMHKCVYPKYVVHASY